MCEASPRRHLFSDFVVDVDAAVRDWPRELFIDLQPGVRIRYCRSEHHQRPVLYAITPEVLRAGEWLTVCLWDNADDPSEHHEHKYNRASGKQPARLLHYRSSNEAMSAAITAAGSNWQQIIARWEGTDERH